MSDLTPEPRPLLQFPPGAPVEFDEPKPCRAGPVCECTLVDLFDNHPTATHVQMHGGVVPLYVPQGYPTSGSVWFEGSLYRDGRLFYSLRGVEPDPHKNRASTRRALYAIYSPADGLVKLGIADDPKKRLTGIQCMSPAQLVLLATKAGTGKDEAALHLRFSAYRSHGEWFRYEGAVVDEVATWEPWA